MRYQKVSNRKLIYINTQNGFRALADSTRRDILQRLAGGEHTIAQLTEHFDMTRCGRKKAPNRTVVAYHTDPDKLAIWLHAPKTPLAEGQPMKMFGADTGDLLMWGDVIVARAREYLEYAFVIKPMGDAINTIKWILTEVAGGTQLSLEHIGLRQNAESFGLTLVLDKGWDDYLARMRTDAQT